MTHSPSQEAQLATIQSQDTIVLIPERGSGTEASPGPQRLKRTVLESNKSDSTLTTITLDTEQHSAKMRSPSWAPNFSSG